MKLVNATDDAFRKVAREVAEATGALSKTNRSSAKIICARDTRPSGPLLVEALQAGAQLADVPVTDVGVSSRVWSRS